MQMNLLNETSLESATISYAAPLPVVTNSIVPSPLPEKMLEFDPNKTDRMEPVPVTEPISGSAKEPVKEATHTNLLLEINRAASAVALDTAASVSKEQLANILDGFAKVLRSDDAYATISQVDHDAQIAQLKSLLLEAQETIITLLNDRVYDRARLAKLDLEVSLLPDLQAQAHRAMGLANRSDTVQNDLTQVRAEIERLRAAYVRTEQAKTGWFDRLFRRSP
jgi:hypothetical protein